jgi:hypothetical protein
MKFNILVLFVSVLLLNSCEKSVNDNEKPEIITFSLNTNNAIPGGQISLNANIADNNLLKSYKITVVDEFGFTADSIEETIRLTDLTVNLIENQVLYTINNYSLPISLNTSAGPYLFKLSVLDDKGNESIEKIENFEIINSIDQPTVSLTEPTNSSIYNQGDTIYLAGLIQDNIALQEIKFECSNDNSLFFSEQFLFDTVLITNFNVSTDGNAKIPLPLFTGNYTLMTNIKDTTGNFKASFITFSVN